MKTKTLILSSLALILLSIVLTSFISKSKLEGTRTEEYAIVDVVQVGKKKFIRISKTAEPTTEAEWKKEKTEDKDDFSPVLQALNQLNAEGYELLNASLAYTSLATGQQFTLYGDARHTFMMVRKIK